MKRAALPAGAGLIVVASPAYADIEFVGQSRATPQFEARCPDGHRRLCPGHGCGTITTVESAPLGEKGGADYKVVEVPPGTDP